ncbi:MAG: class I SAM-dependent methyltransferase [Blautia sp.]|nr:class I SAM-dependent methyltransferase [Blautia sp.]
MAGLESKADERDQETIGSPDSRIRGAGGEKMVAISGRMRMLADLVTAGSRVADVGCDHGFLSIYLVQTGKCPGCLAMDVRKGPLSGAEEHIAAYGLTDYIETRLSDGLAAYHMGEAQTLICAGMGGRLMEKIITEGGKKSRSFRELILQPQSEIPEFRIFLRNAGYRITEEDAVCEDGKFYFAMKAVYEGRTRMWEPQKSFTEVVSDAEESSAPDAKLSAESSGRAGNELYDLYGRQLLLGGHPVLRQYLLKRLEAVEAIIARIRRTDSSRGEARVRELALEKKQLERALEIVEKGR